MAGVGSRRVPLPGGERRDRAADARPPGTSCQDEMLALQLERALSELKAGKQILAFQVGKLRQDIFKGIAGGQVFEDGLDRIPEPADAGLAVANLGVDGDA